MNDDEWLAGDIDAGAATGSAAAALLTAVADTLADAPEDERFDVEVNIQPANLDVDDGGDRA